MEVGTAVSGTYMLKIKMKERQRFFAQVLEVGCGCKCQVGRATDRGCMAETVALGRKRN